MSKWWYEKYSTEFLFKSKYKCDTKEAISR